MRKPARDLIWIGPVVSLAAIVALSACAGSGRSRRTKDKDKPVAESTDTAYVPAVDVTEASLRGEEFKSVPDLEPIYFEYDSANLGDAALSSLKKNAAFLHEHKSLEVLVAGFCDERGTVEYNLALGQKRAKEVREYYVRLGVSGRAVATITYGKEQPVCSEPTEECWARNRRAETRARLREVQPPAPPRREESGGEDRP